jgi:hypothetical protein
MYAHTQGEASRRRIVGALPLLVSVAALRLQQDARDFGRAD